MTEELKNINKFRSFFILTWLLGIALMILQLGKSNLVWIGFIIAILSAIGLTRRN